MDKAKRQGKAMKSESGQVDAWIKDIGEGCVQSQG